MPSVSPQSDNASVWAMLSRTALHSIDPAKNRFRFFVIELWAPPVGTGAALRKRWGRIGTQGRSEVLYFDGVEGARHYADVLLRRRIRRGYVEVQSAAWQLLELEAEAEARLRRIRKQLLSRRELLRAPQGAQEQLALDLTG